MLPLRSETAAQLQAHLATKLPNAPAFNMPASQHTAQMFRADLADAGIPYADAAGRVADFHSLRVTFVSLLAAAGVPVKTMQALARHSAPVLTMNTYTGTLHGSEADAVGWLPDFSRLGRDALRATGTEDGRGIHWRTYWRELGAFWGIGVRVCAHSRWQCWGLESRSERQSLRGFR